MLRCTWSLGSGDKSCLVDRQISLDYQDGKWPSRVNIALSLLFHCRTLKMCEEMSQLLRNIRSIICIFEKYAKDDGDCSTLSKGELKQLIQTEFADVIVVSAENLGQKEGGDQDGIVLVEEW